MSVVDLSEAIRSVFAPPFSGEAIAPLMGRVVNVARHNSRPVAPSMARTPPSKATTTFVNPLRPSINTGVKV